MHSIVLAASDAVDQHPGILDFDVVTLARLFGMLVPLLVAFITKKWASDGVKGVTNAVLSSVAGAVALVLGSDSDADLTVGDFFNSIVNSFIVSITSYYAIYKSTGITGTIANKTDGFGIGGTPPTLETADKGAESPYDPSNSPEGGYAVLELIGALLLVLALVLLVTTLVKVLVVAYGVLIVIGLIGLVLVLLERRRVL